MISTKIQILKIFKSFCQQIKRVQKRFNYSNISVPETSMEKKEIRLISPPLTPSGN